MRLSGTMALALWMLTFIVSIAKGSNVSYDSSSLIIDGERRLLFSGSIHYARSTPDMWPGLIQQAKKGGLDCIDTYVFWSLHEPQRGDVILRLKFSYKVSICYCFFWRSVQLQYSLICLFFWQYNFDGRLDLVKFLKIIQSKGLYAYLRIGPYIASEWSFGGIPYWLRDVPDVIFRTDNEPYMMEMQRFTSYIVNMLKAENLYASQGGPIILQQIENEYGTIERAYGDGGTRYVNWAANMVAKLDAGVPLTMCKQEDAPAFVINTCNGVYCSRNVTKDLSSKPKIWTENWTGWFLEFGGKFPHRPVEDIAYAVTQYLINKGTLVNYYMYHGGTTFGRSAGPFIAPSYDYDAPIDEYGIPQQRKWGHLKDLHVAIKLCSEALLFRNVKHFSLGPSQEAHIFKGNRGNCAAFLTNKDPMNDVTVKFRKRPYHVPSWSVSILPDCETVTFNTAKVNSQSNLVSLSQLMLESKESQSAAKMIVSGWTQFKEKIGSSGNKFFMEGLLEQITTTKDTTDYLWYTISIEVDHGEPFLQTNNKPVLEVQSLGHAVLVFVNGILVGNANGNSRTPGFLLRTPINLQSGTNKIALLSMTVGLRNSGAYYERRGAGIAKVVIEGFKDGIKDLSRSLWIYQIGLAGEKKEIYTESGSKTVVWDSKYGSQPMTWYKTIIDAPEGNEPVGLDLSSMQKGQVWINGEHIGRYWVSLYSPHRSCSNYCDYRGRYSKHKCDTKCAQAAQTLYHVPRSFLKPKGNMMVVFEERGGRPEKISWTRRSEGNICSIVSENFPRSVRSWRKPKASNTQGTPRLHLKCPNGKYISAVQFASFGNPQGQCGNFQRGICHSALSMEITEKLCLGRRKCHIEVSPATFGSNPCMGTMKSLAVEAVCS